MTAQITLPPVAPSRADRNTFATRADAWVSWQEDNLVPEMNTALVEINNNAQIAQQGADVGQIAIASANFKGLWSALTGGLSTPASVFHNGAYWILLSDIVDVTAKVPGVATEWQELKTVNSLPWFTAKGSISTGNPVSINSDGTVSVPSAIAASVGTSANLPSGSNYPNVCFTSSNILISVYYNSSPGSLRCVASSVSQSGTFTLGTEVNIGVNPGGGTNFFVIALDNDRFLIGAIISTRWYLIAGQVDITTRAITLGTGVYATPTGADTSSMYGCAFDSATGRILITGFSNETTPNNRAYVCTVSGTTITVGSALDCGIGSASCSSIGPNKFLLLGSAGGAHNYCVATVSGLSATFTTPAITGMGSGFLTIATSQNPTTKDVVFAARSGSVCKFGYAIVSDGAVFIDPITITSITTDLQNQLFIINGGNYDSVLNRFTFYMGSSSDGLYGRIVEFKINKYGNLASVGETVVISQASAYGTMTYNTTLKNFVIGAYGTLRTFKSSYSTAMFFIGFAYEPASNNNRLRVTTSQYVDENQSNLSISSKYYVSDNGSLTLTPTDIFAGTAVGSTRLLVKG